MQYNTKVVDIRRENIQVNQKPPNILFIEAIITFPSGGIIFSMPGRPV